MTWTVKGNENAVNNNNKTSNESCRGKNCKLF